jgi:5-methylcytosine-specific restriction endonuclease McrA
VTRHPAADLRALHSTRDVAEPLTADLRRLHVTVSRRFLSKLEAARAALSHARPGASAEDILEAGLDLLLAKDAKRRGEVERPQTAIRPAKPDHVPASVKREVWKRDGGRCTWPLASGGVCGSTVRLQLDHVVPRARGGPSNAGNLRLLCAVHNQYAARLVFGGEWMERYAPGATLPPDAVAPAS